jgi:hypothetical protein
MSSPLPATIIPRPRMATPLSDKAKGKQRAVEPPDAGQGPSSAQPASRDLTIRFTEGGSDLIVHVGEKDTVKDVKRKVGKICISSGEELTGFSR